MDMTTISIVLLWIAVLLNAAMLALLLTRVRSLHGASHIDTGMSHPAADLLGNSIPRFHETAMSGRTVTPIPRPGGVMILAFFSSGCSACVAHLGPFRRLAAAAEDAGLGVIAVIDGDDRGSKPVLDGLPASTEVVLAPISSSHLLFDCGVSTFPSYLAVDDGGTVYAAAGSPPELAERLGLDGARPVRKRRLHSSA